MEDAAEGGPAPDTRRGFMTTAFMFVGLIASHAAAFAFGVRYLYPREKRNIQRMFVGLRHQLPPGASTVFRTPAGQTINIVHTASGFVALSDVCPHLGCKVHWDRIRSEFICPCHDGHFDASGQPLAGPPADMNAPLTQYVVVTEGDTIFLDVPVYG